MSIDNADSKVIWMNGKQVPYADATVHVLSHTLHYGTGVFEGIRAYQTTNGKPAIFRLKEHLARFIDSAHSFGAKLPYSIAELEKACIELIRANSFSACYLRPLAFIDDTIRGLKLPINPEMQVAIAAWSWGKYMGDEGQKNGIRVLVSSYRRPDIASNLPMAKITGNYFLSALARREASSHGLDEAILLDQNGYVAEGSGENIFIVKNGHIVTPSAGALLPGITRDSVIQIARSLGHTLEERLVVRNELYVADEVFFTGTAVEVNAIREIDHRQVGTGKPGPVTKAVSEQFFKIVRGDHPTFSQWLTPC